MVSKEWLVTKVLLVGVHVFCLAMISYKRRTMGRIPNEFLKE